VVRRTCGGDVSVVGMAALCLWFFLCILLPPILSSGLDGGGYCATLYYALFWLNCTPVQHILRTLSGTRWRAVPAQLDIFRIYATGDVLVLPVRIPLTWSQRMCYYRVTGCILFPYVPPLALPGFAIYHSWHAACLIRDAAAPSAGPALLH